MKPRTLIAIGLLGAMANISYAQSNIQPHSICESVDKYFAENPDAFMGSIEIQENGKTVYQKALGFADLENKIPANSETRYRIGSISKTFTSVLVLKAAKDGKLSLDDPIIKFFPDANITNAEKITVDMLLYHRSGLRDIVNEDFDNYCTYYTKPQTRSQIVERIAKAGTNFEPDSKFSYSNSGYMLLTFILEDVYGKSYEQIINKFIIKPLQLTNTGISISPIDTQKGFARSYSTTGEVYDEFDPSAVLGAGSIYSTPSDLIKFFNALTSGYFGSDILEKMLQYKNDFGRGLILWKLANYHGFGHTGGIHGFAAALFKIGEITFAFCSNNQFLDQLNLEKAILGIKSEKSPYTKLTKEQLKEHEGNFFNAMLNMDLEITSTDDQLIGQATGQTGFPLDALSEKEFECKPAGIRIIFSDSSKALTLNQNGRSFMFVKTKKPEQIHYLTLTHDQLEKLVGVYSHDALKMDISVFIDGDQLKAQAKGQAEFPLNAVSETSFEFKAAGIAITFDTVKNEFTLNQMGQKLIFVKQ